MSRENTADELRTAENINIGSFQRIADSLEIIVKSWIEMEDTIRRLRNYNEHLEQVRITLERRIRFLRGVITKLKKQSK